MPAIEDLHGELPFLKHVLVAGGEPPRTVAGVPAASWDSILSDDERDPNVEIETLDIASIMFTSGTTGVSKGCMLPHRYGIYMAVTTIEALGISSEDCIYTGFPIYHMGTAYSEVLVAIIAGCRVAIRRRFSASRFWDEVREFGATRFLVQGSVARILENAPPSASDIDNPVELVWGGPLPRDPEAFERRFGVRLIGCYGLTDAGRPGVCGSGPSGPLGELRTGAARVHPPDRRSGRGTRSDRDGGRDPDPHRDPRNHLGRLLQEPAGDGGRVARSVVSHR